MTSERDFDRITRAWLDAMPDEAPDHAIAAVLEAVERTPQVRRRLGSSFLRFANMSRPVFAAGFGAILVVAVLGALSLLHPPGNTGVTVSPTPSVIASPAASAVPASAEPVSAAPAGEVPASLQGVWVGAPASDAVAGTITKRALNVGITGMRVTGDGISTASLGSTAAVAGDQLTLTSPDGGICPAGATATATWTLSPGGRILTLASISDANCPRRAALLVGPWYRVDCKNANLTCLGSLEPGTYSTQFFDPLAKTAGGGQWGTLTYTVPAGWGNFSDWSEGFGLTNRYATYTSDGAPVGGVSELGVYAHPAAVASPQDCSAAPTPSATVGSTPTDLAAWLATVKGLTTTKPTAVTVGGHPGVRLRIAVSATGGVSCGADGFGLNLFVDSLNRSWNLGWLRGAQSELTFVDIGGATVMIDTDVTGDTAALDKLASEAQPIIDSLQFH